MLIDSALIKRHQVQRGQVAHQSIKNIIAVGSGKGGVGKSTTSVNLAVALAQLGLQVGVLDADIYGPSMGMLLGVAERPESLDGKTMQPLKAHGVHFNTMAVLVDQDEPMIWRGPMVSRALVQLLEETNWPELDIMIVDLPPGTGDIQLTLSQKIPVAGAVVVTTPQDIALLDARRAVKMFEKVGINTLGVIENMSTHVCSTCGTQEAIFGEGGAAQLVKDFDTELLGQLPLHKDIRLQSDEGQPIVAALEGGAIAQSYQRAATSLIAALQQQPKDFSASFGKIDVQINTAE
jgi:ATP-binding protein involved in chromosome partitioning